MQENYKRKKISFAKLKRKQTRLVGRRDSLYKELRDIQKEMEKECETQKKIFEKYHENKKVKSYLLQEDKVKYNCVFKERSMEAYNLLADIMTAVNIILEIVLGIQGSAVNLESFQVNHKTILAYLCRKGYWYDYLHAAPNICLINDVLKAMEDTWMQLKVSSSLLEEKKMLYQENRDLQKFLKHYYYFEKQFSYPIS